MKKLSFVMMVFLVMIISLPTMAERYYSESEVKQLLMLSQNQMRQQQQPQRQLRDDCNTSSHHSQSYYDQRDQDALRASRDLENRARRIARSKSSEVEDVVDMFLILTKARRETAFKKVHARRAIPVWNANGGTYSQGRDCPGPKTPNWRQR